MVRVQFWQTKVPVSFTSVDENVFLCDIKKDTDPLLSHLARKGRPDSYLLVTMVLRNNLLITRGESGLGFP
jgi:hypothetical protein